MNVPQSMVSCISEKAIMPPHHSNDHNTQTEDVYPTLGMRTCNKAHTLEFVTAPGVPPIQTSLPRAPRAP